MAATTSYTRKSAIEALRALARSGPVTSRVLMLRQHVALYEALRRFWGTLARARKAAGVASLPNWNRRWNRALVLAEIRLLHAGGQRMTFDALRVAGRVDLLGAAKTYVGSWSRARDIAGVPPPRREPVRGESWTRKQLVAEIRDRRRRRLPLASSRVPPSLRYAGIGLFGGWRAAIEAAGIDYRSVSLRDDVSDEEIFAWLRETARKHPRWRISDVDARGKHARKCARRWGSVEKAARAAGIVDWPVRERAATMTEDEVIATLRGMARAKAPLHVSHVRGLPGGRLLRGALFWFGSWDAAIEAAGLAPVRLIRARWTRETAIAALRARHRAGRSLGSFDLKQEDASFHQALRRLFGSFEAAIKAAGLPYVRRYRRWTDEQIRRELRRAGRGRAMLREADVPSTLASVAKRRYGTWTAACAAAGVTPMGRARA